MSAAQQRALVESLAIAVCGYVIAAMAELVVIKSVRPTEWELAGVSDVVLAAAFGVAVYLWRHLLSTRRELAARQRAEVVLETQLSVAADIQRRLLPAIPPPTNRIELAAALTSAGKIGGDFYDFVEREPGVWVVLLADISGKGIPAALALGSLRSAFRTLARQHRSPSRLVAELSGLFYSEWQSTPYVTCIVCVFDLNHRAVTFTNAGHPYGILLGRDGMHSLTRGGPPAGLLPNARFDEELLMLHDDDVCVLLTDGVSEALEDEVRLADYLRTLTDGKRPRSARDLCDAVLARARAGAGPKGIEAWEDDETVIVVRIRPERPHAAPSTTTEKSVPSQRSSAFQ